MCQHLEELYNSANIFQMPNAQCHKIYIGKRSTESSRYNNRFQSVKITWSQIELSNKPIRYYHLSSFSVVIKNSQLSEGAIKIFLLPTNVSVWSQIFSRISTETTYMEDECRSIYGNPAVFY